MEPPVSREFRLRLRSDVYTADLTSVSATSGPGFVEGA